MRRIRYWLIAAMIAGAVPAAADTLAWRDAWESRKPETLAAAVVGGSVGGKDLLVCRADMTDGWHPGKVWNGACHVGWGGKEIAKDFFEVLTASPDAVEWVPYKWTIPGNAVASDTHKSGTWLYVCRAKMDDGATHPGKVWDRTCRVGRGGDEKIMRQFDVLVHLVPWAVWGRPRETYPPR